jgi:hypothetical protein
MRACRVLCAFLAVASAPTVAALAGEPVTNGAGVLQLEATVNPATAVAPRTKPTPIGLTLDLRYRSVSGTPTPPLLAGALDLPVDMNVNLEPRPRCRLSMLLARGLAGCPGRSRVGWGTAVLDARPAGGGYPLNADVRVLSAIVDVPPPIPPLRPAKYLVIYAFAPTAEAFIPVYPDSLNRSGLVIPSTRTTIPEGVQIEQLSVTFRRMRWPRSEGGKPLIQAPTSCAGSWDFAAYVWPGSVGGPELDASDEVPCEKGGRGTQ